MPSLPLYSINCMDSVVGSKQSHTIKARPMVTKVLPRVISFMYLFDFSSFFKKHKAKAPRIGKTIKVVNTGNSDSIESSFNHIVNSAYKWVIIIVMIKIRALTITKA